jgi:hypothetical protein
VINGETPLPVLWWLFGPLLADWWIHLSVLSAVLVLALLGVVHLAVGRIVPAPVTAAAGESEATIELPGRSRSRSRPLRTGTLCDPAAVVPPDHPTQVIDPAAVARGR